jgi:hypothetical protein
MIDTLLSHAQAWPFWGQAAFVLLMVLGPSAFLIAIVAEVIDAIEARVVRRRGRRWRKW